MNSDATTTTNRVVLFADILGFAALTETCPIDIDVLRAHDRLFAEESMDLILGATPNKLTHCFSGFHIQLRALLNLASMRHPLTAITFSDSVFVATTRAQEALAIAVGLVRSMLLQDIPIRIGIGYGSFSALRFRSDITADSGDHTTQFLGTGVIRAYRAEKCGIKGLRILLHPSVVPLLHNTVPDTVHTDFDEHPISYLSCSDDEIQNEIGVHYEIDYWHFRPTIEVSAWHSLQDMWDEAPLYEAEHYEATAEAINRMRIAQGCVPLKKLRRRTLP